MKNQHIVLFPSRRRSRYAAVGVLVTGMLALSAARAATPPASPSSPVPVRIDHHAVNRGRLESASYSDIAKRIAPSVVKITTEMRARTVAFDSDAPPGVLSPELRQFFGQEQPMLREPPRGGLGSGVIVSADGHIVTNNHVVADAERVTVTLQDGREFIAQIIGRDPQTDVALVKIDATGLDAATFAESSQVEVGDRVLAVGNPLGIGETVTSGIVSATGRRAGLGLAYEDFIQTDAAINPGNSGGALVDVDGRLIGLNTAILSRSGGFQGIGLAVPSDLVRYVVESLGRDGKVVRGYLGVSVQNLTPALAESFKLKTRGGALVTDVLPDSPAAQAGLRSGDLITALDGRDVTDAARLGFAVSQTAPGTAVELLILRDAKTEAVHATVAKQPRNRGAGQDEALAQIDSGAGMLNGVGVADMDARARDNYNIPAHVQGALITAVDPGSASARAGLRPGDVILEINHTAVKSAETAVKLTENGTDKKTLLKLWSRGGTIFAIVDESKAQTS